jgi:hypothetical protein
VDPLLRAALAPVLRDIERTAAPMPTVTAGRNDEPELPYRYADLSRPEGGDSGAGVDTSQPERTRVVSAAEDVQDWMVHYLWQERMPTNWPVCPRHSSTHPLTPVERDDAAVWICPDDQVVIAPIGSLG